MSKYLTGICHVCLNSNKKNYNKKLIFDVFALMVNVVVMYVCDICVRRR